MVECVIRTATAYDVPAITAIYDYFVCGSQATFEIRPPDAAEMQRRRLAVLARNLPYLVAELEGYVVGYCYAAQFRPREGYRFTVEDSIYVRSDCVGYGVGKRLLGDLIAGCQRVGCHRIMACICGDNPASVALHVSLGFTPLGTIPEAGYKFGEWVDVSMMQRAL